VQKSYSRIARRARRLAVVSATAAVAIPATASAATTPTCNAPALAEVYSWAQDTNWYAALPGIRWDGVSATGWTLSGGAKLVTTTLADGTSGQVLDLPSGAVATSPQMCVSNSYPTFRSEIKDVKGSSGVTVAVSYLGLKGWGAAQTTGTLVGVSTVWSLPGVLAIKPSLVSGWQYGRFTFTAAGKSSEYQLSNSYADPRMAG
jgi:hypothetical protein